MRSWKNVFQLIIDPANVREAVRLAARDKGDLPAVRRAMANPDAYVEKIVKKLENDEWRPPPHEWFRICDGINAKPRDIVKPPYEEQVVHHAVMLAMQPIFMKGMYEYSCGSIPGRGPTYGKKYLKRWLQKNSGKRLFVLKMDIQHFFQNIDQQRLISMLERIIKDEQAMSLLRLIITCEKDPDTRTGIPIGFYSSQWLSNYYLQGLDYFIKQDLKAPCYVRYMDDMVIIGPSKRKLHAMRQKIEEYLQSSLGLKMKDNWQVFAFEYMNDNGKAKGRPIDFMGFVFHYNRIVLRRSIYFRGVRKGNRMKKGKPNWYNSCQMLSYCGYFKQGDCYKAFQESIRPHINLYTLKKVVGDHDRRRNVQEKWMLGRET